MVNFFKACLHVWDRDAYALIDKPIPFDFLIDGQLLRTSIVEYLNAAQLSTVCVSDSM